MEIEINKNTKRSCTNITCWQIYTRNKLNISVMVGSINTSSDLKYPEIILEAKKTLRKEIRNANNSEYVFQSKIYG